MDFRKPEEDDKGETFDNGRSPRDPPEGGSASITEETVRFGDEEVTVADATGRVRPGEARARSEARG